LMNALCWIVARPGVERAITLGCQNINESGHSGMLARLKNQITGFPATPAFAGAGGWDPVSSSLEAITDIILIGALIAQGPNRPPFLLGPVGNVIGLG